MTLTFRRLSLLLILLSAFPLARAQDSVEGPLPQLHRDESQPPVNTSTEPPAHVKTLDNDAVIRMTKAELADSIIVQAVRTQPGSYRTNPEDLIALKSAGVSPAVISAMLARTSGMQQRPSLPIEVTPLSLNNDDPGVYYKDKSGQWQAVDVELVHYRDGGALKSLVTNNIVKKDLNGEVSGPKSRLNLSPGTEMLILAPNNMVDAVEYIILRFHDKGDRREFRVRTGNVFHSETGSDRDALDIPIRKVSRRIFSFTVPADITKGQFGVLAPGGAAVPGISNAGKIYTFSISE